jgi:lactoylglutathione lyase
MIGFSLIRYFSRPFKVMGVQQIALGHLDKNVLTEFWSGKLGIPKVGNFQSEK